MPNQDEKALRYRAGSPSRGEDEDRDTDSEALLLRHADGSGCVPPVEPVAPTFLERLWGHGRGAFRSLFHGRSDSFTALSADSSGTGAVGSAGHEDADFGVVFELVEPVSEAAHELVAMAGDLLRAQGCHVRVFPLKSVDTTERLASERSDTHAYVMTVCSKALAHTLFAPECGDQDHASQGSWIADHAAFKSVASLRGAARLQQLTQLVLREGRVLYDLLVLLGHGAGGPSMLNKEERLISALRRHDDKVHMEIFPLHREDDRAHLWRRWRRRPFAKLPLQDVFQYFGPKLAMYFAWLEFYTDMLAVPALTGLVVVVAGYFNARSYILLTVLISIGTSLFTDFWRRRQRQVEYAWKYRQLLVTEAAVVDVEPRAEFQGEWMADPVTGQRVFDFPHGKRFRRQLLAIPLLLGSCALVAGYVIALNMLSEQFRDSYPTCFHDRDQAPAKATGVVTPYHDGDESPLWCRSLSLGPSLLNAASIFVMDRLYQRLAVRLNEYENYRTSVEYEAHLVLKRMPFHFVNSNASLWFLAFYVQDLTRVRQRLWVLMVLMQVLDNAKEVGWPLVVSLYARGFVAHRNGFSFRFQGESSSVSSSPSTGLGTSSDDDAVCRINVAEAAETQDLSCLQRVLTQRRQARYVDTFSDYKEMMVQYGYVALYTPVFPLAPLFAWLNNGIESRSDFFKLLNMHGFQRPIAEHTQGIGVWERVLVSFSVVAVLVNCALVWIYELPNLLPQWSELHRFMLLMACEHLVFLTKVLLNWAAPNLPTWLQNEKRLAAMMSTRALLTRAPSKRK